MAADFSERLIQLSPGDSRSRKRSGSAVRTKVLLPHGAFPTTLPRSPRSTHPAQGRPGRTAKPGDTHASRERGGGEGLD